MREAVLDDVTAVVVVGAFQVITGLLPALIAALLLDSESSCVGGAGFMCASVVAFIAVMFEVSVWHH